MSAAIIFFIVGMLWSYYRKFQKEQDEKQAVREQMKQSQQSAGISEGVSFADLYGSPQGRTDGISEGQTLEWQSAQGEVVEPIRQRVSAGSTVPENSESTQDAASKKTKQHLLSKQNLKQAILLNEILSEPRSKRPWKPNRHR